MKQMNFVVNIDLSQKKLVILDQQGKVAKEQLAITEPTQIIYTLSGENSEGAVYQEPDFSTPLHCNSYCFSADESMITFDDPCSDDSLTCFKLVAKLSDGTVLKSEDPQFQNNRHFPPGF